MTTPPSTQQNGTIATIAAAAVTKEGAPSTRLSRLDRNKSILLACGVVLVLAGSGVGIWQGVSASATAASLLEHGSQEGTSSSAGSFVGAPTGAPDTPTRPSTTAPSPRTLAPTPTTTRSAVPTTTPPEPIIYTIGMIRDDLPRSKGEDTNPTSYSQGCHQPTYVSKNGQIVIVTNDNAEIPIAIKGVNWFGMETASAIPFGLWTNDQNGTTLHEIASFLRRHQFNSVRLPLAVSSILANTAPNKGLVNEFANAAVDVTNYTSAIGSIVQGLGHHGISVLLDLHNLSPADRGAAWFSDSVPEADTLLAIQTLAAEFCSDKYWNILGVDLKNEPSDATWGDAGPKDFHRGATLLGNHMLRHCPNWLAFVEGNSPHVQTGTYGGQTTWFMDWWGGGMRDVGKAPLQLTTPNKVVYAPHYYSPSVYPQDYLVQGGKRDGDVLTGYKEWDDATLEKVVAESAEDMFGYLRSKQDGALVLGEFGGLFNQDAHANKTNQRVTQHVIKMISTQPGYAGGYVWSLNPESGYEYSSSGTKGYFMEGLLDLDWVHVNTQLLEALEGMNRLNNLKPFPCLPANSTTSSSLR